MSKKKYKKFSQRRRKKYGRILKEEVKNQSLKKQLMSINLKGISNLKN